MNFNRRGEARPGDDRVASYPHLAAVVPAAITPGLGLVSAGVAWLFGRHFSPRVDVQGRAAIDFQLTMIMAGAATYVGLVWAGGVMSAAVLPLLLTVYFMSVITPLFAATATSRGEDWRYPLSLRLMGRRGVARGVLEPVRSCKGG